MTDAVLYRMVESNIPPADSINESDINQKMAMSMLSVGCSALSRNGPVMVRVSSPATLYIPRNLRKCSLRAWPLAPFAAETHLVQYNLCSAPPAQFFFREPQASNLASHSSTLRASSVGPSRSTTDRGRPENEPGV